MKKFLALLLAAMMLLSCTTALAAPSALKFDTETNDNSTLIADKWVSRLQKEDGQSGDVKTELWMKVEASGQIDVTVPLVLVFSTNIDGGDASVASNYTITNNNPRNSIAVDKIAVAPQSTDRMTLVAANNAIWNNANSRDYYSVTFTPVVADETKASENVASGFLGLDMHTNVGTVGTYDLYNVATKGADYDLTAANKTAESLMTLGQSGVINMVPYMKTTPLTFVTNTASTGDHDSFSTTHGVHLLNVTYTVGLKYNDKVGTGITAHNEYTVNDEATTHVLN